jgi:hypothetical protein
VCAEGAGPAAEGAAGAGSASTAGNAVELLAAVGSTIKEALPLQSCT